MFDAIYLPKLDSLTPTLASTLLKAMEEAGELARAVLKFLPYEQYSPAELADRIEAPGLLADVAEELLDVAQVCVTMIFVMEEYHGVNVDDLVTYHLRKLTAKNYRYDESRTYSISTRQAAGTQPGNFKCLNLPRLAISGVTLLTTVCKIQEELGELTQYIGKHSRASGEKAGLDQTEVFRGSALELLDVAQCCFTMMYILAERYAVDIPCLVSRHVAKLKRKGYCS
ncbi:MAG TPA: nucleotide pyrophosphohydrolase [Methylomusa anaerophila]|uniref:MazG nucleotide pyrophosphohydrolase domain protein n=1 Tax=Methylomusa anaerophila TaxID=1930071 RepID=A0A348AKA9_9FIRM|nr:nucleotide pyrophosphohydrolase [Methylomusa anaerophila]BBB91507.1 MazG nucleotide pyrophosphohydrolase domain protein [Methylomusa anaerophila]HML89904.1 nucleotide pyrophosphohydrolase [Methylomusa anaerophila]